MYRSPRRAGARASACAYASNMSPSALRSFAISLAIAIAITDTPAYGFTIRRTDITTESISDQVGEESSIVEVRYDMGGSQGLRAIADNSNKGDLGTAVIAINETDENAGNKTIVEVNNIPRDKKVNSVDGDNTSTNVKPSVAIETTSPVQNPVEIIIPLADKDQKIDIEDRLTPQISKISSIGIENDTSIDFSTKGIFTDTNEKNTPVEHEQQRRNQTNINDIAISTHEDDNVSSTISENLQIKHSLDTVPDTDNVTIPSDTETLTSTDIITDINLGTDMSFKNIIEAALAESEGTETTSMISTTTEMDTTTEDLAENSVNIESTRPDTINTSWKKYTTIDRKRPITTTEDNLLVSGKDLVKAETIQTNLNLDNVIGITSIPSLEKLRQSLTSVREFTTEINIETTTLPQSDLEPTIFPQVISTQFRKKFDVVMSKRGGYLVNTVSMTRPTETTTVSNLEKTTVSFTDATETAFDFEPSDSDGPVKKTASGIESQSQLAEDAIKEELLKEETLNDNEQNAKRYREDGVEILANPVRITESSQRTVDVATEETLSVRPIIDKKINASLYAVNPNYKPLKKIDVQPPKQFVRDPDDNSWRNESISSLGIVFKPKNSSKSFTQVLKNKTETELNNTLEKDNKGVPDLRVRLEKMAEVRKRKKKINQFGDVVYSDYEENSGENITSEITQTSSSTETPLPSTPPLQQNLFPYEDSNANKKDSIFDLFPTKDPFTSIKPKKVYNIAEYYDSTDEYDTDYAKLTKIDLKKKFTMSPRSKETTTHIPEAFYTSQLSNYVPDRQPTVQYFPPTKKTTQKVNVNDYDNDFQRKVNLYTFKESPKVVAPVSYNVITPIEHDTFEDYNRVTASPKLTSIYKPENINKNLYLTNKARVAEQEGALDGDGNYNRASYVIKHYRDFINEAAKDEDDRSVELLPYTESPVRGVTINELAKLTEKDAKPDQDYEYDSQFHKEVLNRFVNNFNQHSDRFKVDFPILYNNSVIHKKVTGNGKALASSNAFLKRQYEGSKSLSYMPNVKPCEPQCDKLTVELSPDYELHYFVPEQEEKEEIEQRPITAPYRYRNSQLQL